MDFLLITTNKNISFHPADFFSDDASAQ